MPDTCWLKGKEVAQIYFRTSLRGTTLAQETRTANSYTGYKVFKDHEHKKRAMERISHNEIFVGPENGAGISINESWLSLRDRA